MINLTKEQLLSSLPEALSKDENIEALAEAVAEALAARSTEIDSLMMYPDIDHIPEALLDILAYDFKVDWWDSTLSLTDKRNTLKTAWDVHRKLGTKKAVIDAVSSVFPNTTLQEWFEYSAEPFHFKLRINAQYQQLDPEKYQNVLSKIKFYKNIRSVLDGVEYDDTYTVSEYQYAGVIGSEQQEYVATIN